MNFANILRFSILGIIWLAFVIYIIAYSRPFTLYTAFICVASGIIIFVPMYKKYIKNRK